MHFYPEGIVYASLGLAGGTTAYPRRRRRYDGLPQETPEVRRPTPGDAGGTTAYPRRRRRYDGLPQETPGGTTNHPGKPAYEWSHDHLTFEPATCRLLESAGTSA